MSEAPPRAEETAPDAGDRSGAASEAQRRAKVERLRAAGVNPYPHSFEGRTHVEEILAAHDPAELGEGEHDAVHLPGDGPGHRQARPRQGRLPRRPRHHRHDPGLRPPRRARRGGLRADRRARHRRPGRGRGRRLRDQARAAGDRRPRVHAAGQGAARPARPLPRHLRPGAALPPARTRPDGERGVAGDLQEALAS